MFNFANVQTFIHPFRHWVIPNFLSDDFSKVLSRAFSQLDTSNLKVYRNPLEGKQVEDNWRNFSEEVYEFFFLCSTGRFLKAVEEMTGIDSLCFDPGLHASGMFIQSKGDHLHPHIDYLCHPKLKRPRVLNLLLYLNESWNPSFGGRLNLFGSDKSGKPNFSEKKSIDPIFNTAVFTECTTTSWHAVELVNFPADNPRKVLALYFLKLDKGAEGNQRAIYSHDPTENDRELVERYMNERDARCKNIYIY